jgi:hypothetical protein
VAMLFLKEEKRRGKNFKVKLRRQDLGRSIGSVLIYFFLVYSMFMIKNGCY